MERLTDEEGEAIQELMERFHLDPSQRRVLEEKLEELQEILGTVGRVVSGDRNLIFAPGEGWAFNFETNTITYPVTELLTRSIESLIGTSIHEGSHRDLSRINPEEPVIMDFFREDAKRVLLNAFEDPRVNNWANRKFAGAGHYMKVLYNE